MKQPELTIMVPVYNEEKTLQSILDGVLSLPIKNYEVIIVDDASCDKSSTIIAENVASHKSKNIIVKHLTHTKNRGKGAAIKTALEHATGKYFVIQDADLEYDPTDIPSLLEKAESANHPVVYGSRFLGEIKNMPTPNYYANKFYNFLIRRLYPTSITDMHTCYKMVSTEIIKDLDMTAEGFDYATELISKLLKRGYQIVEVPIHFDGRSKKEGKKIDYKDGVECIYKIIHYRFAKVELREAESENY